MNGAEDRRQGRVRGAYARSDARSGPFVAQLRRSAERPRKDGRLFIARGSITDPVDFSAQWEFAPLAKAGDKVSAASWLGEVKEQWVSHKIMVPFTMAGNYTVKSIVAAGKYKVTDTIAVVTDDEGREHGITMVQKWPVKQAVRCYVEKPRPSRVMVTGVRAIDTFNPMAEGGTGFIPGPFGAGKTVLQHAISKQADADYHHHGGVRRACQRGGGDFQGVPRVDRPPDGAQPDGAYDHRLQYVEHARCGA